MGGFWESLEAFGAFWKPFGEALGGSWLNCATFALLCAASCCIFAALVVFSVPVAVVVAVSVAVVVIVAVIMAVVVACWACFCVGRAKLSGACSGLPLLTHAFAGVPSLSVASLPLLDNGLLAVSFFSCFALRHMLQQP